MIKTANQRLFIALAAIAILVIGAFIGSYIAVKTGGKDIDAIVISLSLTNIALLLIIASFVLQIREFLQPKRGGK